MPEINPTVRPWSAINPDVWKDAIAEAFDRGFAAGQLGRVRAEEQIKEREAKIAAKIAALIDALRFYANEDNYQDDATTDGPGSHIPVQEDEGRYAQAVLARYAVDDEGGME